MVMTLAISNEIAVNRKKMCSSPSNCCVLTEWISIKCWFGDDECYFRINDFRQIASIVIVEMVFLESAIGCLSSNEICHYWFWTKYNVNEYFLNHI